MLGFLLKRLHSKQLFMMLLTDARYPIFFIYRDECPFRGSMTEEQMFSLGDGLRYVVAWRIRCLISFGNLQ